ncbi:flagellar basal body-associated protein FliL [Psychrosphaera haliotis]|jgi:flagellar FliL protein|uniref:Flagellar protein FliL n=1 Tax=Psychrosphaera haliotis TaxID=555083 RepID=A0A6N8FFV5_9GAMM|nr:flagellar basal body-associated protein FliL [Psychrosphaera haliotis]MUH73552.1 flagellar basal body-associated protein FliL [Psychrosphaera haliotis]
MLVLLRIFIAIIVLASSLSLHAAGEKPNVGYYGFEPDIITNYVSNKRRIGFVRITAELMVEDVQNVPAVEHHAPLLRDAMIDILIRQPEQKVKSMTGREEIRILILEKLKELMKKETGQPVIKDLIFTKYLYS